MNTTDSNGDAAQKPPKKRRGFKNWLQNKLIPVEEVGQNVKLTRNMFSAVVGDDKSSRKETFDEAIKRQGLSEKELLDAYKRQRIICFILASLASFVLLYIMFLLITAREFTDYFVALMATASVALLGTASLRSAFRAWQIRSKRLGGFDEFLRNSNAWRPSKITSLDMTSGKSRKMVKKKPQKSTKPQGKPSATA